MIKISKAERERVIALIQEGKPLPLKYRSALFAGALRLQRKKVIPLKEDNKEGNDGLCRVEELQPFRE